MRCYLSLYSFRNISRIILWLRMRLKVGWQPSRNLNSSATKKDWKIFFHQKKRKIVLTKKKITKKFLKNLRTVEKPLIVFLKRFGKKTGTIGNIFDVLFLRKEVSEKLFSHKTFLAVLRPWNLWLEIRSPFSEASLNQRRIQPSRVNCSRDTGGE